MLPFSAIARPIVARSTEASNFIEMYEIEFSAATHPWISTHGMIARRRKEGRNERHERSEKSLFALGRYLLRDDCSAAKRFFCSLSPQRENVKLIKRLVASHVPAAGLLSNVGAEISFQLPNDASPAFKGLLSEVDTRKDELSITRCASTLCAVG